MWIGEGRGKVATQRVPQSISAGSLDSAPSPVPSLATVSTGSFANVAPTDVSPVTVSVQSGVVPAHPPVQPVKAEPSAAAACRVTDVPIASAAGHAVPQSIPPAAPATVPSPDPER